MVKLQASGNIIYKLLVAFKMFPTKNSNIVEHFITLSFLLRSKERSKVVQNAYFIE